ncbi:hypothetical protein GCM10007203_15960 [Staphylococcus nepalensis]|nr:hypothetical protein GCM10007203_15960 [Staphylococcus nepalensis]
MNIAVLLFSTMCFLLSYEFLRNGHNKKYWLFIAVGFITLSIAISNTLHLLWEVIK